MEKGQFHMPGEYAYVAYDKNWGYHEKEDSFTAPDGQSWADESHYQAYAAFMNIVYECSDGSLANSYLEFKDWERMLAYHPNEPVCKTYAGNEKNLSELYHLEHSVDGTIWRDETLLEEFLQWKKNHAQMGVYTGHYGIASNFPEYAKIYNAAYFVNQGLMRPCQFVGAYGFFYSTPEQAKHSLEMKDTFQMKMKVESK